MRPPQLRPAGNLVTLFLSLSSTCRLGLAWAAGSPLWVQPSEQWDGIDGDWSSFAFEVGSPAQTVYLTPATALSEIWIVEDGGCAAKGEASYQLCSNARGGVFDPSASSSWDAMGAWQLGMNNTGMGGNGDYGLDTVVFRNTLAKETKAAAKSLIAAINDTNYYNGYLGLGVTSGKFGSVVTSPLIPQLAETDGYIPSLSYGYTAGAYYRDDGQDNGTVGSLVLGGYDRLRMVPHDTAFSLDPQIRLPTVRLRGITAQVPATDEAPTSNWTSSVEPLVAFNDSITAMIDTSTPYLWLPEAVCDRFAAALNLSWRSDLGVYVFNDADMYNEWQSGTNLSFVFSLSSYDDVDNFGSPLDAPGVVNITVAPAAFAQVLRYPFKNAIPYGSSAVPYFPLARSTAQTNNNQYIIGRAFMQEAYLVNRYEEGTLSVHQAAFPPNAATNYSLQLIERPADSPYPAYAGSGASASKKLSTGATAGIAVGVSAAVSAMALAGWLWFRKRLRKRKSVRFSAHSSVGDYDKEDRHPIVGGGGGGGGGGGVGVGKGGAVAGVAGAEREEPLEGPVRRIFTRLLGARRSRHGSQLPSGHAHEIEGSNTHPAEAGESELYELPGQTVPVELDAAHEAGGHGSEEDDDHVALGLGEPRSRQSLSAYERAHAKLQDQLRGAVPPYSAEDDEQVKSMQDVSSTAHHRPDQKQQQQQQQQEEEEEAFRHDSSRRPFSSRPISDGRASHDPTVTWTSSQSQSPLGFVSPGSPMTVSAGSYDKSGSSVCLESPTSPVSSAFPPSPSPTFQRTPIADGAGVICLGPMPKDMHRPHEQYLEQQAVVQRQQQQQQQQQQTPQQRETDGLTPRKRDSQQDTHLPEATAAAAAAPRAPASRRSLPGPPYPAKEQASLARAQATAAPQSLQAVARAATSGAGPTRRRRGTSASTLGSNFTVEEDDLIRSFEAAAQPPPSRTREYGAEEKHESKVVVNGHAPALSQSQPARHPQLSRLLPQQPAVPMQQGPAGLPLRHRHTVSGGGGSNSSGVSDGSSGSNTSSNTSSNITTVRPVRSLAALSGAELEDLHVPQVADRRYSWEDEIGSQARSISDA